MLKAWVKYRFFFLLFFFFSCGPYLLLVCYWVLIFICEERFVDLGGHHYIPDLLLFKQ